MTNDVSVVMTTHNRCALMATAIRTVLGQRDVDLELIVVDNGSTDDTPQMLRQFDDSRLRVLRNERSLGATGGRNAGLAAASGRWVGMLDDDDLWAPGKLRAQLDALAETRRTWSYTGCVYIDGRGRLLAGTPPPAAEQVMRELPYRYVIPAGLSSMIWERTKLDEGGLIDPRLAFADDWDLSLRLARQGPPAAVAQPLVAYRQHATNHSRQAAEYQDEYDLITSKSADLRRGAGIDYGAAHRFVGSQALLAGDRFGALRAYVKGWRMGDRGCLARMPAAVVPRRWQPWLRRTFLSDAAWLSQARSWLSDVDDGQRRP